MTRIYIHRTITSRIGEYITHMIVVVICVIATLGLLARIP